MWSTIIYSSLNNTSRIQDHDLSECSKSRMNEILTIVNKTPMFIKF